MPGPLAGSGKCREFVGNLKRMRELSGWSQEDLAMRAHVGTGTVAMTESFQRVPQVEHGVAYDRAFGLNDVFAKAAREIQGQPFPPSFRSFTEDEKRAADLFTWEHSLVPGLFQTERYARACLERHPDASAAMVQERVAGRLARQEILARDEPGPPRVWALLDEHVLRCRFGDAGTMREQLLRLVEVSGMPNVTVQVLPGDLEGHVGLLGAFTIAEWPGQEGIVNSGDIADGRVCDDPAVVAYARLAFRAMQAEALNVHASRDLIAKVAEELWNGTALAGARALTAVPAAGSA